MNYRWYIGAMIAIVSFFVVEQQSMTVPNQEIVLTFLQSVNDDAHQKAVLNLTEQLVNLGAENVTVSENEDGSLKVTYYSHLALQNVKNKLFLTVIEGDFTTTLLGNQSTDKLPLENDLVDYQIDIYEIQKDATTGIDLDGKCYFEIKQDFNRGSQIDFFVTSSISSSLHNNLTASRQKVCDQAVLSLTHSFCTFPEVRAGPLS